jgi:uncharacterized protein with HEPN domain
VSAPSKPFDLLKTNLEGASKVAKRLVASLRRVDGMMPLDAKKVDAFGEDDEERFDAFIFRFNSLTAMVQDHVTRGILLCEEEDARGSKRDQRHLMEKLGALKPELNFGTLAELRNRIAHHYPDDSAKQAEIINEIFSRSRDLLEGYNTALKYADAKIFGNDLDIPPVTAGRLPGWDRT